MVFTGRSAETGNGFSRAVTNVHRLRSYLPPQLYIVKQNTKGLHRRPPKTS